MNEPMKAYTAVKDKWKAYWRQIRSCDSRSDELRPGVFLMLLRSSWPLPPPFCAPLPLTSCVLLLPAPHAVPPHRAHSESPPIPPEPYSEFPRPLFLAHCPSRFPPRPLPRIHRSAPIP